MVVNLWELADSAMRQTCGVLCARRVAFSFGLTLRYRWNLRADHTLKRTGTRSTEGTELASVEIAIAGVRRSSIAGVRHDSGEVSTFSLPYRA